MSPAWCARNHPNLRCYVALHRFSSSTEIRLQPLLDLHWQQGCNIPLVALFFFWGGGGNRPPFSPPFLFNERSGGVLCAVYARCASIPPNMDQRGQQAVESRARTAQDVQGHGPRVHSSTV